MAAPLPFSPPGTGAISAWARERGCRFSPHPDAAWFEAWEPFDTMVAPEAYFNALSFTTAGASVTLAEPWLAPIGGEPLGRAILAYLQHPAFVRRAAARGGEHFNTRVAFLDRPPPPRVAVGDRVWDEHMATFAASPSEAAAAFPVAARRVLAECGYAGHLEIRPGGAVLHHSRIVPEPAALDVLVALLPRLVTAFVSR
ncbi:MAG: hypothetical protein JW751_09660 [Polyangiaceae bacterium]|nr:hypothetical protein [Polyangiaceae bacterium]